MYRLLDQGVCGDPSKASILSQTYGTTPAIRKIAKRSPLTLNVFRRDALSRFRVGVTSLQFFPIGICVPRSIFFPLWVRGSSMGGDCLSNSRKPQGNSPGDSGPHRCRRKAAWQFVRRTSRRTDAWPRHTGDPLESSSNRRIPVPYKVSDKICESCFIRFYSQNGALRQILRKFTSGACSRLLSFETYPISSHRRSALTFRRQGFHACSLGSGVYSF
jgi:hypothetical protein